MELHGACMHEESSADESVRIRDSRHGGMGAPARLKNQAARHQVETESPTLFQASRICLGIGALPQRSCTHSPALLGCKRGNITRKRKCLTLSGFPYGLAKKTIIACLMIASNPSTSPAMDATSDTNR